MLTVKRIINGDRVITVHERVRLGDKLSRVYKEALKVVNGEDNELCFDNAIDLPRKTTQIEYESLMGLDPRLIGPTLSNIYPFLKNFDRWVWAFPGQKVSPEAGRVVYIRPYNSVTGETSDDEIYVPGVTVDFVCRFVGFTLEEMSFVMPSQEVELVRELVDEDGNTFYQNQLRSGKHAADEAIGVLHVDDAYEFFYPGDVVYVMNNEGKTIDTLR
ncbi:hypothetical protein ID964_004445 [Salmonella enterica]|nr:hypothetical protein [Salmonella enterica]